MTVQELIDSLSKVDDKSKEVQCLGQIVTGCAESPTMVDMKGEAVTNPHVVWLFTD
jgi:hypothetical protein